MALRIRPPAFAALACLTLALPACSADHHFTFLGYTSRPNYECKYRTIYVPIFKNRTLGAFRQDIAFDLTREVINQIQQKTPWKVVDDVAKADTELTGTVYLVSKNVLNRNQLNEIREVQTILAVELVWRDTRTGEVLSQPSPGQRPPPLIQMAPLQSTAGQQALGQMLIPAPPVAPLSTPAAPLLPPAPTQPLGPGSPEPTNQMTPSPAGTLSPGAPGTLAGTGLIGAGQAPTSPPGTTPPGQPAIPTLPGGMVVLQSLGDYVPEFGQSYTTALQQNVRRMATQIVSMMEKPW